MDQGDEKSDLPITAKKIFGTSVTILTALAILSVSFLKIATVNQAYSPMVLSEKTESEKTDIEKPLVIDYELPFPGKINPDNTLWYAKAVRDRVWYIFTFNKEKKTELNLLFADKRLKSSLYLFENNKPDLGLSTLTKAEKYLEMSVPTNANNIEYLEKIATASLKHREVIENQILPLSPEDIAPQVNKINDSSKETYKKVRDLLYSKGQVPPENIFELK